MAASGYSYHCVEKKHESPNGADDITFDFVFIDVTEVVVVVRTEFNKHNVTFIDVNEIKKKKTRRQ